MQLKGIQASRNIPIKSGLIKVEARKTEQNLPENLRKVVIQISGNRPLSEAEKSNIISAANGAMADIKLGVI